MPLQCPACGSRRVAPRPPSQISPRPGYECRNCGTLMRDRGMLVVYLGVLLMGCAFVALFAWFLASGDAGPPQFVTPVLAAVCVVYAVRQLMRPVPKRERDEDDEDEDDEDDF